MKPPSLSKMRPKIVYVPLSVKVNAAEVGEEEVPAPMKLVARPPALVAKL